MSSAAKPRAIAGASQPAENDVLHFLTRTLQAHFLDARPQDMLTKLKNLQNALDQQEITLSEWPDSPSKERICAALAKAQQSGRANRRRVRHRGATRRHPFALQIASRE